MFVVRTAGHKSVGHEFVTVIDRLLGIFGIDGGGGTKFGGGTFDEGLVVGAVAEAVVAAPVGT